MAPKKISKTRQKIHDVYEENEYASLKQNQSRARSLTIGNTTGGIIEVNMRSDFSHLWYSLHPVEAVEIIEQLAAAAGLQVAMRPKQDFTSWRSWDTTIPGSAHWLGAAPWQLPDEEREYLGQVRAKNIQAIEESKKVEALQEAKNESE